MCNLDGGGGGSSIDYSGSSSGGSISRDKIESEIETSHLNTRRAEFEAEVNDRLKELLSSYNDRDTELVNERLQDMRDILSDYLDSSINIRRAGSWSKHTYVDGLSDVDCLFVLNSTKFAGESPQELIEELQHFLQEQLGSEAIVEKGDLSLKVTYKDGPELQILPALKNDKGVRIPSGELDGWSRVVNPEKFAQRLTDVNQRLNGNVIPVIKLAKGAMYDVGLSPKVKGYHAEALAVDIFREYEGERTKKAMLEHFFMKASESVKRPIKEVSGQSQYVDDYLGPSGSKEREAVSTEMKSIYDKLSKANDSSSADDWLDGIGY